MVCGGLPASSLVTLHIVPNSGGGLWWFAVVCGGLRRFAMVCGGLPFSRTRLRQSQSRQCQCDTSTSRD